MDTAYNFTTIAQLQADLRNGKVTAGSVTSGMLQRARSSSRLNVYLELFEDSAKKQATEVDRKLASGKAGRLAGVIVALKDNICYKGHRVSAASKILGGFESLYNATVVERLLAEDAIIIGRANCDEFAMGSSNENSAFGPVLNPLDEKRVPGGSSGGAAAAVAAGICHVSLGSDTGGSIRQPASFTGTVGLKPTYGRVSRYGLIAYASSFDQIGPITRTVEDAAIILEVIAGRDRRDSTSSSREVDSYSEGLLPEAVKPCRIAYIRDCLEHEGVDPQVRKTIENEIAKLRKAGHIIEPVDFPYLDFLVPTYYVLTTAEASSNLSRFAGIHYGFRSPAATDLESTYKKSRSEGFGKEVKRRIMLGTFVLSAGYYDAYYSKGQKVRRFIYDKTREILARHDFILTPSTPGTAFEFGKNGADPIKMYLEDIFTVQANIAGVPAISVPVGKDDKGMPVGLQLMAGQFREKEMMSLAAGIASAAL